MSRIGSLSPSSAAAFQGEKLSVESPEETPRIYRTAAYVTAAAAALWAVTALVIWIAPFA